VLWPTQFVVRRIHGLVDADLLDENLGVADAVLIGDGVEGELDAADVAIVVPGLERLGGSLLAAGNEPGGHQKMAADVHVEPHGC